MDFFNSFCKRRKCWLSVKSKVWNIYFSLLFNVYLLCFQISIESFICMNAWNTFTCTHLNIHICKTCVAHVLIQHLCLEWNCLECNAIPLLWMSQTCMTIDWTTLLFPQPVAMRKVRGASARRKTKWRAKKR